MHQHIESGWYRLAVAEGKAPETLDPVARADAFISTHFASQFDIEYVARNVSFVSASHLTRLFRRRLGISPHARLRRPRLGHAAELLLQSTEPVATISNRSGYRNTSHFIRDFRALYGKTPGQYRKEAGVAAKGDPRGFPTVVQGRSN